MKVVMLGHKRVPSREGGIEIVVTELSKKMAEKGVDITLYNRSGHNVAGKQFDDEKVKEFNGVKIKRVLTVGKGGISAATASFFGSVKAAFSRAQIVHYHAEGPCAFMWIPKLFGKKVVATIHGLDHNCPKWSGFARKFILKGEKTAVKKANAIIVLSENEKKYFKEKYGRETVLIPNGVNKPEKVDADLITKQFGLESDGYILYLGRIVEGKGIEYLIEAYKQLKTDRKLVIAGGVSDSDDFFAKLKEQAKDNADIIFTGFVQGQVLSELYSNCYAFVLPSDSEGMSISLLEAMSYGCCTVVSDIPACTSVIEDMGVAFRKGSVEDLRDKLQELIDDKGKTYYYKQNASDFILNKYNWDDVADKTLSLYESVLGK